MEAMNICSHQSQAQERPHRCMQELRASPFEGRRLGYSADAEVGRPASGDLYDRYGDMKSSDKDAVAQTFATPCMQRCRNDRRMHIYSCNITTSLLIMGNAEGYFQTMSLTAHCTAQV